MAADDITLVDGKTVFHNAKIISHDAQSVTIKHSRGITRVMIPELPPELRAQFKYDSDRAKQEAAQEQQSTTDHNAHAAADEAHRKALEAWNREAVSLSGKILSVSGEGILLTGTGFGAGDTDLVFVKNVERGLVDGEQVSVVAVSDGTHHYTSVNGAARTVPAFDAARP